MAKATYKDIARAIAVERDYRSADEIALGLAEYLVQERRVGELDKILREVERLEYINRDIVEVEVSSAHETTAEVDQSIRDIILELFSAADAVLVKNIDKDLVGGVKIQALGTLIDLSVRGQLNQLRSHKF